MVQEDPDLSLVQALMLGEDQALDALMNRHREGLFRFVSGIVHNEADALELAAETFARAYFNIKKFRPAAKFGTWLYQIALNLCRDHLRSRAYRDSLQTVSFDAPTQEQVEVPSLPPAKEWVPFHARTHEAGIKSLYLANECGPDQKVDRLEELDALEKAVKELPAELKEALILVAFEDRPLAEAAALLGISAKAIEMRVYRARKLLFEKMSKIGF
jgi:RNA polymerase sigma factor (sigma-70 family)